MSKKYTIEDISCDLCPNRDTNCYQGRCIKCGYEIDCKTGKCMCDE